VEENSHDIIWNIIYVTCEGTRKSINLSDVRIKQQIRCIKYPISSIFCHKTLHVSGIFCAYHLELFTVH